MHINGRSIEAAIAGSLMVDRPEAHPTAGARLLRSFLAGPQDLSFSETANDISQRMWEKAGGERLASSSLDWVRVLRPAGLAVAVAKTAFRPASVLRPVAFGIDRLIAGHARNPLTLPAAPGGYHDAEATSVEIAELIPVLSASYAVHPDWRSPTLPFLLAHAETKERYGELQRRIVYGKGRGAVGCYLCYMRRGEVARVLQVLALPYAVGPTLDSMFAQAARLGCVAVRGRAESALLDALIARHCLLFHGAAIVMHARDKSLMDEVRNSRVVLTGLAGESWTRFVGGEFA
jgi:hypothetical protein